jgi:tetratricopeptide (TPR) repeat protein
VTVRAQLEAGEAAVAAGAWEAGLESLREAAAGARRLDDAELQARVLSSLGSALVHAARGHDEEGSTALHEAKTIADSTGQRQVAARTRRELAYVELLRARYERARAWLEEAAAIAGDDDGEYAWIAAIRGACETEVADYPRAASWLRSSLARAEQAGDGSAQAFALAFIGRFHLLRGELEPAEKALSEAVRLAQLGWTSFLPWPEALLAEVQLQGGDVPAASAGFEHAYALGRQLSDPCWESIAERGLGLVAAARQRGRPRTARAGPASLPALPRLLPLDRGVCPGGTGVPRGGAGAPAGAAVGERAAHHGLADRDAGAGGGLAAACRPVGPPRRRGGCRQPHRHHRQPRFRVGAGSERRRPAPSNASSNARP